jgi:acetoin utilization deacetylase AcuC-like enzyme
MPVRSGSSYPSKTTPSGGAGEGPPAQSADRKDVFEPMPAALTQIEPSHELPILDSCVRTSRLIYRREYLRYNFGPEHPLRPERLTAGLELLAAVGFAPPDAELVRAPAAGLHELLRVHAAEYIEGVQQVDLFLDDPSIAANAARWGLGRGDCPAFEGMHRVASLVVGGTLAAVRGVLEQRGGHAFNPAGGMHHAQRARAAGFCIYNDAAVAIAAAVAERNVRVLYLDFDAHHADGVQAAFYDDPRVLTLSLHETGQHLFPGTGELHELGERAGRGYSLNLPLEPYTEDADWIQSLEQLVRPVAEWFAPDLVVSQHGADTHAWDPLTHMRLSTDAYVAQARLAHELAHELAHGRWVALGGGGYDWLRVVPRSWAITWAEMTGRALPQLIPAAWRAAWEQRAADEGLGALPRHFLDNPQAWTPLPQRAEIQRTNRERLAIIRTLALPSVR